MDVHTKKLFLIAFCQRGNGYFTQFRIGDCKFTCNFVKLILALEGIMQINNETLLFEKLFREHYPVLCAYATRYVVDNQVAEDIVQNFYITVWEKGALSAAANHFLPYAYRSVQNGCINYFKAEITKENFLTSLAEEWSLQLEEEEDFIYKKEVREALSKLPEKCKSVFLLKCVTGLKYKEIAEVTDISVNTVKYHLGEGFRIMREELKDLSYHLFLLYFVK